MVNMNSVFAVFFFVATVFGNDKDYDYPLPPHLYKIVDTKGEQYQLYLETTQSINLAPEDKENAFIGLNIHDPNDPTVNSADLNTFFWHKDLKFAVVKTIKFLDEDGDEQIKKDELDNDFKKKPIRVALIECHYLLSKGLKQSCFADQLLTYASLVLGKEDVQAFYESIGGANGMSSAEAEGIEGPKANKDPEGTAEELGAYYGNNGVTLDEFTDYVTQESVADDFRRCRADQPDVDSGDVKFKNDCLQAELAEYTNDDLTEIDISVLYRAVDKDGKNGISKKEIQEMPGVKGKPNEAELVTRVINLLDMSLTTPVGTEAVIDYGEFRSYMRSPTVQLQAERQCTEQVDKQRQELDCLFDLFVKLVTTNHDAIWLVVPDLEQQIAFEIMDTNNDGEIKSAELNFRNDNAETRFIEEMRHDDSDYICLEEWNEYMDIPHMVYGTADCLLEEAKEGSGRGTCYPREVQDIIDNIRHFDKNFWIKWFKWYDSDTDGVITAKDKNELQNRCGSKELEELFLDELGMGDRTVTEFEFSWYVKQQELADRYEKIVNDGKKEDDAAFNKVLMEYIQNYITEYDIQVFFGKLDHNNNHELEKKDFDVEIWQKVMDLIKKIDDIAPHKDADKTANFREFWLWLNSEKVPGATPKVLVKDYFENKCTKKHQGNNQQEEEIKCYVEHFKKHSKEIYN